jgi:predicted nuclease of predicted toxin-antitoxin system
VKFLVDMPLSPRLAEWLRAEGHEAIHAWDAGMSQATDADILQRARDEGRVVITADLDFPRLLAASQLPAPGIILFRGGAFSEEDVRTRLTDALRLVKPEELASSIVVIEKHRLRKRSLPV